MITNISDHESSAGAQRDVPQRVRRMTRRGFAWGGGVLAAGLAGWRWVTTREEEDGLIWPLRRVLSFNERIARAGFGRVRLAPVFPRARAAMPRVNGGLGLGSELDPGVWRLEVSRGAGGGVRSFSLNDIRAFPRVEMTTELKCIEGWSQVVHWTGARLVDLAAATGFACRSGRPGDPRACSDDLYPYVSLETPDAAYYVSLDIESALHPQTLLCYEMGGEPLTDDHGAPLRLVIPVKYGIKNLKRLGRIRFTDRRPSDYWAERGYDWYSGL